MGRARLSAGASRARLWAVVVTWLAFVAALQFLPRLYPPPEALPNVASLLGYNIPLAYWLILAIATGAGLVLGLLGRPPQPAAAPPAAAASSDGGLVRPPGVARRVVELLAVAAVVAVLYWPPAIARFGPHIEDHYFLAVLWRMACGQVPYADFEFLYGPLMVAFADGWTAATGFSMAGYYSGYLALQLSFYLLLVWLLQHYLPRPGQRYLAFLVLFLLTFDVLFGLNWIAWRYFSVVLIILLVAAAPTSLGRGVLAGCLIGLQAAISHEYGIAALLAALAMYGVMLFYPERRLAALAGAFTAIVAVAVWVLAGWAVLDSSFGAYVESTLHVSATSAALGLGQFAFGWSLHALALFVVLSCALALFSGSLRGLGRQSVTAGDLQLIGATAFLVIALRVALQRADFLHMAVPFVPLILILLLNRPRSLLATGSRVRRVALAAIAVAVVAQTAAYANHGRWVLFSQARGIVHELQGRATVGEMDSRRPSIHRERTTADPQVTELAARLAVPDVAARPVLFYGSTWTKAVETGVCPVGYSFYDILYSDGRRPLSQTLAEHRDLLVVMRRGDFARLFEDAPAERQPWPSALLRLLTVISSAHYPQSRHENEIEFRMWEEALGTELSQSFGPLEWVGDFVLLERRP